MESPTGGRTVIIRYDQWLGLGKESHLPCERPGWLSMKESGSWFGLIVMSLLIRRTIYIFLQMWQSCAVCGARTPKMNVARSYFSLWRYWICSLFSSAKILELYSPTIYTLNSFLIDHTTPPSENSPDLPASRLYVRHFSTVSHSPYRNLWEVPRL